MLFLMLMILCVNLEACSITHPIVVIKNVDYGDGKDNTEPKDKTTWMWITYPTAKQQLHWINHSI